MESLKVFLHVFRCTESDSCFQLKCKINAMFNVFGIAEILKFENVQSDCTLTEHDNVVLIELNV